MATNPNGILDVKGRWEDPTQLEMFGLLTYGFVVQQNEYSRVLSEKVIQSHCR